MKATDGETICGEFYSSETEVLRVIRLLEHGRHKIKVRYFFRAGDDTWRPGKQGFEVKADILAPFVGAILDAGTLP